MNLNVETQLHNQFKAVTAGKGEKMTDVLIKFIKEYVDKHSPEKSSKKGPR